MHVSLRPIPKEETEAEREREREREREGGGKRREREREGGRFCIIIICYALTKQRNLKNQTNVYPNTKQNNLVFVFIRLAEIEIDREREREREREGGKREREGGRFCHLLCINKTPPKKKKKKQKLAIFSVMCTQTQTQHSVTDL